MIVIWIIWKFVSAPIQLCLMLEVYIFLLLWHDPGGSEISINSAHEGERSTPKFELSWGLIWVDKDGHLIDQGYGWGVQGYGRDSCWLWKEEMAGTTCVKQPKTGPELHRPCDREEDLACGRTASNKIRLAAWVYSMQPHRGDPEQIGFLLARVYY